jgi:hypothetical protein
MISNSIAEMRTYGEGFIIVDQSPAMVAQSAITNTNTKTRKRFPMGYLSALSQNGQSSEAFMLRSG